MDQSLEEQVTAECRYSLHCHDHSTANKDSCSEGVVRNEATRDVACCAAVKHTVVLRGNQAIVTADIDARLPLGCGLSIELQEEHDGR